MDDSTTLLNFRLPATLKDTFEDTCKIRNVSMTSQLILLIEEHIKKSFIEFRWLEWMEQAKKNEPVDFLSSNEEFYDDWLRDY